MDEMEIMATLKAMRMGWIFIAITLAIWGGVNYYHNFSNGFIYRFTHIYFDY